MTELKEKTIEALKYHAGELERDPNYSVTERSAKAISALTELLKAILDSEK